MTTTTRISDARDIITDYRDESEARVKRAEEIYADFAGKREHGGLSVSVYGDYVLVDDEADRWLAEKDEFVDGLKAVLYAVVEKGRFMDDDDASAPYDYLCNECPALYSRIGSGTYNNKTADLLALLAETLDDSDVEEITDYLGIEIEEEETE